jgi:small-conductance mechanosensitive channel
MPYLLAHWRDWLWSAGVAGAAILIGLAAHYLLFLALSRFSSRKTKSLVGESLLQYGRGPAKLIFPLLALVLVLPFVPLSPVVLAPLHHVVQLGLMAALGWLAIATLDIFEDLVTLHHDIKVADNLAARRIRTQVRVLQRVAMILIVIMTLALMLMTFPNIRHIGDSLFASAGVAALVAGLAARSTLGSLIAGIQIALTQPIRLDDVVIVEGEWGWIEEINTTYVVVRIWDLRRLVVPLTYFIEKPFQNWTRQSADLLGTVFVYTDYTVPVEEVRQELHRILQSSELWDKQAWGLQVTDSKEHTLELRALMSASDSSKAWDLRCFVREKLVEFLQQHYPQSLPRTRAEVMGLPEKNEPSATGSTGTGPTAAA